MIVHDMKKTLNVFSKKQTMTRRDITDAKIIANIILYNDPVGPKLHDPISVVGKKPPIFNK